MREMWLVVWHSDVKTTGDSHRGKKVIEKGQ